MHSSDSLDDGYLGSGKVLRYSRKKYGDENHVRDILEFCSSRDELKQREKEIVCETLLADPLNINLKYGGEGGWDHIKAGAESQRKGGRTVGPRTGAKNSKAFKLKLQNDPIRRQEHHDLMSNRTKAAIQKFGHNWQNRKHSQETKDRLSKVMRNAQLGKRNSQFGKHWVTDGSQTIRILAQDLQKFLDLGFIRGKKIPGQIVTGIFRPWVY